MLKNNEILDFENKLWQAADKLRNNMDAAEYKHVVLGLIFLKYISDSFEERHEQLQEQLKEGADPEDPDEYRQENLFWVPEKARWNYLQKNAKLPKIGKIIDEAMELTEKENPALKGVLPKNYARETLDKRRLGELIDLIGTIGLGDYESRSKDILGKVYEYFLGQFASAEGKKGGEFYNPEIIVKTLDEMLKMDKEVGVDAISLEFFCLDLRVTTKVKEMYKTLGRLAGIDYLKFYHNESLVKGYERLNPKVKEKWIFKIRDFCLKNNILFAISDPHYKELNTTGSCCGLPDEGPLGNYEKVQPPSRVVHQNHHIWER